MSNRVLPTVVLLLVACGVSCTASLVRDPELPLRTIARAEIALAGGAYLGEQGVVLQRTPVDCGPAALANLLAYLGTVASPDTLAVLAGTTARGTRLGGLVTAAAAMGHRASAVRVAVPSLRADDLETRLPAILWLDRRHFVAVTHRREDGQFVAVDPLIGRYSLPFATLARRWSGEAMVLE